MKFMKILVIVLAGLLLLLGLTLSFIQIKNERHYRAAISEIKENLRDPDSLIVYFAFYSDTEIGVNFGAKNGFGAYGSPSLAIYGFSGEDKGDFAVYDYGDLTYNYYKAWYSTFTDFPSWLTEGKINPIHNWGYACIALSITLGTVFVIVYRIKQKPLSSSLITKENNRISSINKNTEMSLKNTYFNELERIKDLFDRGIITEAEFLKQKGIILEKIS